MKNATNKAHTFEGSTKVTASGYTARLDPIPKGCIECPFRSITFVQPRTLREYCALDKHVITGKVLESGIREFWCPFDQQQPKGAELNG